MGILDTIYAGGVLGDAERRVDLCVLSGYLETL